MHTLVSRVPPTIADTGLVSSDRLDFHPTMYLRTEGSSSSLEYGDWYDLCCPSSRVEANTIDVEV